MTSEEIKNDCEEELRLAKDNWNSRYDGTFSQIQAFSLAAMKAPALASAGGIAAALGFYSANYNRFSVSDGKLDYFSEVLFWWALALMIAVILPGIAYMSQQFYVLSMEKETFCRKTGQYEKAKVSKRFYEIGNFFRYLVIALTIATYVCMFFGGYYFWLLAT